MTRDQRVKQLVDARLSGTYSPREEAAECVAAIRARGITCAQIATRCGVPVNTVHCWGQGKQEPGTPERWARLATMARSVLPLQVIAKPTRPAPAGMTLVLFALRLARGNPPLCELSKLVGAHRAAASEWTRGRAAPNARHTRKLRALVLRAGLDARYVALCDDRLRAIKRAQLDQSARFREIRECVLRRTPKKIKNSSPSLPQLPGGVGLTR